MVPHSVVATGLFTVLLHLGLLETEWVLAVVHAAFALPLALLLFISALQAIDPLVWSAAATLGASPRQVLLRVILRTIWPSVLSAALLVFIFSWDEVVAAVFIGPVAPATLPALMFSYLLETVTPAVAAGAVGAPPVGCQLACRPPAGAHGRAVVEPPGTAGRFRPDQSSRRFCII